MQSWGGKSRYCHNMCITFQNSGTLYSNTKNLYISSKNAKTKNTNPHPFLLSNSIISLIPTFVWIHPSFPSHAIKKNPAKIDMAAILNKVKYPPPIWASILFPALFALALAVAASPVGACAWLVTELELVVLGVPDCSAVELLEVENTLLSGLIVLFNWPIEHN